MPGVGIGIDIGVSAQQAIAGGGSPTELFPDPTLAGVTDAVNGWSLGGDTAPANGGAGPGIEIFGDPQASLVGTNLTTFNSAVANSSTKTVTITAGSFAAGGDFVVSLKGGLAVTFAFSGNGDVSHSVTAGTGTGFDIQTGSAPCTLNLTHISVT